MWGVVLYLVWYNRIDKNYNASSRGQGPWRSRRLRAPVPEQSSVRGFTPRGNLEIATLSLVVTILGMKKLLLSLAAVALVGAGCAYKVNVPTAKEAAPQEEAQAPVANLNEPQVFRVQMVPGGFNPAQFEVLVGTNVVFENKDTAARWPASGVHPTHQLCPGFDALGSVAPGSFYSHIFTEKKECPFHDHLSPNLRGKLSVK